MNSNPIFTGILAILNIGLLAIFLSNDAFFEWAYRRHENLASWYIRPFLLIPFGVAAYRRSWNGILLAIFLILTSMFWFPQPAQTPPEIRGFLEMEQQWIQSDGGLTKALQAALIPLAFLLSGWALWRRSLWQGVLTISGFIVLKVIWSLYYGGRQGAEIIIPALLGIVGIATATWLITRKRKRHT